MSKFLCFLTTSLILCFALHAAPIIVNTPGDTHLATDGLFGAQTDLRGALNQVMTQPSGTYVVQFVLGAGNETIHLSGPLPVLGLLTSSNPQTITIDGANSGGSGTLITLDGGNTYRGLVCRQGTATIQNMNFQNMLAKGGNGGITAGGGGLGAGAAVLIDQATVTLANVSISHCTATGGDGAVFNSTATGGGGGGMGGDGGNGGQLGSVISAYGGPGGGGGLGGNGGNGGDGGAFANARGGNGGGGGVNGNGGDGGSAGIALNAHVAGGGGGGGVGFGSSGTNGGLGGGPAATVGGDGGSSGQFDGVTYVGGGGGGAGGSTTGTPSAGGNGGGGTFGGTAGPNGGGGGGGSNTGPGQAGDVSGNGVGGFGGDGGGGGGSFTENLTAFGIGGDGGGGGGGANGGCGGNGGWGGGAGFRGATTFGGGGSGESGPGFPAGFGGGGGGSGGIYQGVGNTGSASPGGFGGGGGGTRSGFGLRLGGVGAGQGGVGFSNGGGGGAGLGGAIFVNSGGTLTLSNTVTVENNAVNLGNSGGGNAAAGAAATTDVFLITGNDLILTPTNPTDVITISQIGDDSINTLPGPGYNPGFGSGNNVDISGSGSVILTGINTYSGGTNITSGTLYVNGSLTSPGTFVSVSPGGTLRGIGTIPGTTDVFGTISAGNSIGTLTVANLILETNSTLNVELTPFQASLIQATTSVVINSGSNLTVTLDPGSYATMTYTILTVPAAGFTLAPLNLISPPGFNFQVIYTPNSILLYLQRTRLIPTDGLTRNALATANYLNTLSNLPAFESILNALSGLRFSDLKNALNTISPSRNSFTTFAAQNTMFLFSRLVSYRLSTQRLMHTMKKTNHGAYAAYIDQLPFDEEELLAASGDNLPAGSTRTMAREKDNLAFWVTGFGEFSHQKAQDQNPSFRVNTAGELVGYDYYGFENGVIGAALGFAHSDIHKQQHFGNGRVDYYTGSFYGTGYIGNGYVETSLWGTYNKYQNKRHVFYQGPNVFYPGFNAHATSSHKGYQITPHMSAGYDFIFPKRTFTGVLEPFASVDWVYNSEESFSEHGATPLNMNERHRKSSMLRSELGLNGYENWKGNWGVFIVRETLSYVYKKPYHTGIVASVVGAPGTFSVESFTKSQNLVSPSLEIFYRLKNGGFFSLTYEGEYGSGYTSNEVLGEIGVFF